MSLKSLNHDTLDSCVALTEHLLVDMWASWCGPCQRFSPVFAAAAAVTPDITFASFQVDASPENQEMFASLGFTTVPTLLAFRDGTLVANTSGFLGRADIAAMVDAIRAVTPR
ncbi:MAG: thioredoxin family protein [Propionibacteriaceae bacterium]|jgi:thioredoxin 1|nr:thioredoxin family protein [Propionibacteriaceae bacterium]